MTRKSNYPKKVKTFGDRIKKKRMDKGLNLYEVGDKVGVTHCYISKIENDIKIPSLGVAILLARFLGDSEKDYLEWVKEMVEKAVNKVEVFKKKNGKFCPRCRLKL